MSAADDSVILLTGATGMVGRELLVRMARRPGTRVLCPVRASDDAEARRRVTGVLDQMPHPLTGEERNRVEPFQADITYPRFGLDAKRWDAVAAEVTRIVHGAASVSWSLSLDDARRINVGGTVEMLRLAEAAARRGTLRAFDYLSTVLVAGRRHGIIGEEELDDSAGYANTYEQSKAEAERLVRAQRGTLPIAIFRLSMVVGDSRTGYTSSFNVMYWPMKMLSRGTFWIVTAARDGFVDLVPIDFAADAIEALSGDPAQRGKSFHIAAGPDDCTTIGEMLDLAADLLHVRRPILVSPTYFAIVRPLLLVTTWGKARDSVNKGRVYIPYLVYRTRFDVSQARAGLVPYGLKAPPIRTYMDTLINYAKSVNWGASSKRSVAPGAPMGTN